MLFTSKEARFYAKNQEIDTWAHAFLNSEGNNVHLSAIMKQKGFWNGPAQQPLSKMRRICGPEKGLKYHEREEVFHQKIEKMLDAIKKGWDVPPLIVWYDQDKFSVADGNHRLEALKQSGHQSYWTIVWSKKDLKSPVHKISNSTFGRSRA